MSWKCPRFSLRREIIEIHERTHNVHNHKQKWIDVSANSQELGLFDREFIGHYWIHANAQRATNRGADTADTVRRASGGQEGKLRKYSGSTCDSEAWTPLLAGDRQLIVSG